MSARMHAPAKAAPTPSFAPARTTVLQRRSTTLAEPTTVPPIVEEELRSPGQPLDPTTRASMESAFGHDFSRVRVHAAPQTIQTKLTVSQPEDKFEREADRVADQVMRMPDPRLLRQTAPEEKDDVEEELLQTKPLMRQRVGDGLRATSEVPPIVHDVLRSPGRPLDTGTRNFMASRFGHDFSQVRIHTDAQAAETAQAVKAQAFTVGRDIVFGAGQYAPETVGGKRLLAHELVHTVQQGQGDQDVQVQRACGSTDIAARVGTRSACTDRFDSTFVSGSLFKFNVNCDTFESGQNTALIGFAGGLASTVTLENHGFASVDGDLDFNKDLGCARAMAAQKLLTDPPPGGAGIPASRITGVINHGPVPGPAADRRSVVIKTSTPAPPPPATPVSVAFTHIQAPTSPTGMPDRIPPRINTIVVVGIAGYSIPMRPITLSIDGAGGGNGTVTINGAATVDLTSTAAVRLRGVNQTSVGNAGNLRLVADQGATRLAASNNFSVSSIPQNLTMAFSCLVPDPGCASVVPGDRRGFKVRHTWDSDSTVPGDLSQTDISERVETDSQGGSLGSNRLTTSGYLGTGTTALIDEHAVQAVSSAGFHVLKQTQMFKDLRSGAADIPVTNSGYEVGWFILPIPGTGFLGFFQDFEVTTMKYGSATTALGVRSNAGSGYVTRKQRV